VEGGVSPSGSARWDEFRQRTGCALFFAGQDARL